MKSTKIVLLLQVIHLFKAFRDIRISFRHGLRSMYDSANYFTIANVPDE